MQAAMLNATLNDSRKANEIFTYIAIPIEAFKQTGQIGDSLELVPNLCVNLLQQNQITAQNGNIPIANKIQFLTPKLTLNSAALLQNVTENGDKSSTAHQPVFIIPDTSAPESSTSSDNLTEKNHTCPVCRQAFDSINLYKKHMSEHSKPKRFKCQQCSSCFNVEVNLKLHTAIHRDGTPTCPVCNRKFQRLASLKSHLLVHQVEESFTCDQCMAEFENEGELNKHLSKVHVENVIEPMSSYQCSLCGVDLETYQEHKKHMSQHFKLKVMMKGRKMKKTKSSNMRQHKCSVCGKTFSKLCLLERHVRIHTGEKPFSCHLCNRSFTQKGTLQIHLVCHSGVKPYQCTLCPAKFCQKGNLRVHVQKTHVSTAGIRSHKCLMCNCIFKRMASLNSHITRVHAGLDTEDGEKDPQEKQLVKESHFEDVVGIVKEDGRKQIKVVSDGSSEDGMVKFVRLIDSSVDGSVRQLLVKQKKIDDSHWYMCTYCTKGFKKPSDLIRHIRTHTKEKPYKCDKCGQAFSLKSTLTSHVETHSETRGSYKCTLCLKVFATVRALNAHLRRHIKNTDIKCTVCDLHFESMDEAKEHVQIYHSNDIQESTTLLTPVEEQFEPEQPMVQTEFGLVSLGSLKVGKAAALESGELVEKKKYKCQCGAKFSQSSNLKRHMHTIHAKEKKYKCIICFKGFNSTSALKDHSNYHNDDSKHACKICNKKFGTFSILKRHMVKHNIRRPYVCPYCKMRFKSIMVCRKHIKIHKWDPKIRRLGGLTPPPDEIETACSEIGSIFQSGLTKELEDNNVGISVQVENNVSGIENRAKPITLNSNKIYITNGPVLPTYEEATKGIINVKNVTELPVSSLPNLNKSAEVSSIYINFDDLQNFTSSTLYNASLTQQFKNIDPILMEDLGDIPDSNALFATDPTLTQMADTVPLDAVQNFDGLVPFNLNTLGLVPVASKILPNVLKDDLDTGATTVQVDALDITTPIITKALDTGEKQIKIEIPHQQSSVTLSQILNDSQLDDLCSTNFAQVTCSVCATSLTNVQDFLKHHCKKKEEDVVKKDDKKTKDEVIKLKPDKSGKLKCKDCHKVFKNRANLNRHLLVHKAKKNPADNTCSYCGKYFVKHNDLQRHIRIHTGEKPFTCAKCKKSFTLKSTLMSHMRTHDPNASKVSCAKCNSNFSSKTSLRVHFMKHSDIQPYACTQCPQKYRTWALLKSHMKSHEKQKITKKDNVQTKTTAKLTNLLQSVGVETTQIAETQPTQPSILYLDNINLTGTQEDFSETDLLFTNQNIQVDPFLLQQLQLNNVLFEGTSAGTTLPIEVDNIGPETISTEELNSLIRMGIDTTTLETNEDEPLTSLLKTLPDQNQFIAGNVTDPLVKEPRLRNFECDICHKKYISKIVLNKHKKIHEHLVCDKCHAQCDTRESLSEHLKVHDHNNDRIFNCMLCDNKFNYLKSLKTHMKRIHDVELPAQNFECDVCHKSYTSKYILLRHKKTHGNQIDNIVNCEPVESFGQNDGDFIFDCVLDDQLKILKVNMKQ